MRKKITNTVQVFTHLKEKLQFVQGENMLLKNKLKDVEAAVAQVKVESGSRSFIIIKWLQLLVLLL